MLEQSFFTVQGDPMKKYPLILALLCFPNISQATSYDLYIQDSRTWEQWGATVSSVEIKSKVCGMFAYSEMTVVFKDSLSSNGSDSLELTCNFYLPPESVVDSLSLWIKDKQVPAYLLDKWRAWQIYSTIVNRRRDPAFLTVSGSRYYLKIFPFKSHEARKVKINFSSPLMPVGDRLALRMPLDFVGNSSFAPSKVVWEVSCWDPYSSSDVECIGLPGMVVDKKERDGRPLLVAGAENSRVSSTLMCTFRNPSFYENGYSAEIGNGSDNETYFTSLLNIGKMLDLKDVKKKKVLFVWNGVQTSYTYEYRYDDSQPNASHTYYDFSLQNSYSPSLLAEEAEALSKYMSTNLLPGDSFNIILNDGTLKSFSSARFVEATNANCIQAAGFTLTAPSNQEKSSQCKNFADLMKSAFTKANLADSMDIVIIDGTYFYSYYNAFGRDTTIKQTYDSRSYYYHYTYKNDSIDIDALTKQVTSQLPPGTTIYALAYPYQYYGNFKLYDQITQATNGMIFPIYDQEYCFKSLSELMMGKLYPANLTISASGSAYVYDVTGYSPSNIPIYKPLLVTGRISGASDSILVSLKGKFNGKEYAFNKQIRSSTSCGMPAQRQIWASNKVADLIKENSQIAQKDAADISFKHHILTDFTALLALEPNMDSLLTEEERKQALPIADKRNPASLKPSHVNLEVAATRAGILVNIRDFRHVQGKDFSLKIYDLKGRLVANATKEAVQSKGKFLFPVKFLSRGAYIVRLCVGKTVVSKRISIIW